MIKDEPPRIAESVVASVLSTSLRSDSTTEAKESTFSDFQDHGASFLFIFLECIFLEYLLPD